MDILAELESQDGHGDGRREELKCFDFEQTLSRF